MVKMNFTAEQQKVYDLALDLSRDNFSVNSDKVSKQDLEKYLRDTINNDVLKGATLYQAFRRNNIFMQEVVEQLVNTVIQENVLDSKFMDNFVEIKNRALGDKTAFYTDGGLLEVTAFAGNHWDTNRQAVDVGSEVILPKEWVAVHIYEDLDRFLMGISTLDKMNDKIYKSINKYIQDRIYALFNDAANCIPSEFTVTGNSEETVGKLCDKVQAAGGYDSLVIAGTRGALRKLAGVIPDKMFANSQREAKATTGTIGEWEGYKLMPIPQTLKNNTFDLCLDDTKLLILGENTKPIKLEFVGDTRSDIDTTGKRYNDQSVDMQVQTRMGMGIVLPPYVGLCTLN